MRISHVGISFWPNLEILLILRFFFINSNKFRISMINFCPFKEESM